MQRSLAELKAKCNELGLTVVEEKRRSKRPFLKVLQTYFISEMENPPTFGLKYRLSMESPQLAKISTGLSNKEIENLYQSPDWIFEEKYDGIRMIFSNSVDGFEVYSRNLSVSDFLPVCYTEKIFWGKELVHSDFPDFVLDAEIISNTPNISTVMGKRGVVTETRLQAVAALMALNTEDTLNIQKEENQPLTLVLFDCLFLDGKDLRHLPYGARRKYLKSIASELEAFGLPVKISTAIRKNKQEYLEYLWENGGEGIVAKNIHNPYIDKPSRPRNGWIKIKRTSTGTLGDTIDGFVTGFELGTPGKGFENLVGSLQFTTSVIDENGNASDHNIARCINLTFEERKSITVTDEKGNPTLDPKMYGKVAELEGQAISARAKRLTHPRILRWRDDKSPVECEVSLEDLLGMIG